MAKVRIQKLLAESGLASRRAIEEMVLEGKITVNGKLVKELPFFVDPETDNICVNDRPIRRRKVQLAYFLLNKPRGAVCTPTDPLGRPCAIAMVPDIAGRVYCVGGLDAQSSGLVILTNDGEFTRTLTDPRRPVEMTYVIEVDGRPDEQSLDQLKHGIYLDGRRRPGVRLKFLHAGRERSMLEIRTGEGRNEVLRRMMHNLRHKVRRLKRTAIGPVLDRGLKIGHFRILFPAEVRQLLEGPPLRPRRTSPPPQLGQRPASRPGKTRPLQLTEPSALRPAKSRPPGPAGERPASRPNKKRPPRRRER